MKKFLKVAAIAAAMIALCVSCEKDDKSINGKQFMFDMVEGDTTIPCCLDFGVTKAGYLTLAMDMYGELTVEGWKMMFAEMIEDEAELAAFAQRMYDATHGKYISALSDIAYEVVPADSKSGKVVLTVSAEEGGESISADMTYSEWDGKTCVFNCEMLQLVDQKASVAEKLCPIVNDPLSVM